MDNSTSSLTSVVLPQGEVFGDHYGDGYEDGYGGDSHYEGLLPKSHVITGMLTRRPKKAKQVSPPASSTSSDSRMPSLLLHQIPPSSLGPQPAPFSQMLNGIRRHIACFVLCPYPYFPQDSRLPCHQPRPGHPAGGVGSRLLLKGVCYRRKQTIMPYATPYALAASTNSSAGKAGLNMSSMSTASAEMKELRNSLAAERSRREYAEAVIARARPGGWCTSKFPKAGQVVQHVEHLTDLVLRWTAKARASGESHEDFPRTIQRILIEAFTVCKQEVERCLEERLRGLSTFLGEEEPVTLLGDVSMNLDTQYVLYECLCRNFRSIVPVRQENIDALANSILQRCVEHSDQSLAKTLILGDPRFSFEVLLKDYVILFIENPRMTFEDDLGKESTFNPSIHHDWVHFGHLAGVDRCCIIFPSFTQRDGRQQKQTMRGVVRVPSY